MTRIRSNTIAMGGTFLVQAVFVFLQIKILTHWMTPTQYGLFSSVFSLGAILGGFAELGFSVVLVRYGAKFEAEGRPGALADLLKLALVLWFGAGAVLAAALVATGDLLISAVDRPGVSVLLLSLGFFALMSFSLRAFSSSVFQGVRRMTPALVLEMIYMVGVTALYLVFRERLTPGIVLACLLGWSTIVGSSGLVVFLRMVDRQGAVATFRERWPLLREVRSFWGGSIMTTALAIGLENADRLVLAASLPFEAVGAYHVAGRINLFTRKILLIPQQVAKPELTFKWERGLSDPVRADLALFSKLDWVLGLLISVPVVLAAHVGVLMVSNDRYLAAVPVLIALAGAIPILSLQAPLTTFLRASGHIWVSVLGETIWISSFLASGILLLPRYGLAGFASGQIVAALMTLLYTVASLRRMRLPQPGIGFIAAHGAGGLALWAAAAWAAIRWPVTSIGPALALSLGFVLLMNIALVRLNYFTPAEEQRLLGFLGDGSWSRLGRVMLAWPRFGGQQPDG